MSQRVERDARHRAADQSRGHELDDRRLGDIVRYLRAVVVAVAVVGEPGDRLDHETRSDLWVGHRREVT